MSYQDQFVAYLTHYANKDIAKISAMLAEDVTLRDWKISVSGKASAIAETEKNFQAADTVEIEILHLYAAEQGVAGELRITVDGTDILYVVDVVTFNTDGKIKAIRAFIGRGD